MRITACLRRLTALGTAVSTYLLAMLLLTALVACGGDSADTGGADRNRPAAEPADARDAGRDAEPTRLETSGRTGSDATATPEPADESEPTRRLTIALIPREQTSPQTDREALVALYEATDGPNWAYSDNWLTDLPLDEWEYVRTDDDGRVILLYLDDNELSGEIPAELGNLASLIRLDLDNNDLSGEIPVALSNLTSLISLDLYNNDLSGEIPAELGNLARLNRLKLGENQLSGEIPAELGNLANLKFLYLHGNQLSGCVPKSLSGQLDTDWSDLGDLLFC